MRNRYEQLRQQIYDIFSENDVIQLVSFFMILYIEYKQKKTINKKEYDLLTDLAYYAWTLFERGE